MTGAEQWQRDQPIVDAGGTVERVAPCPCCDIEVVVEVFRVNDGVNGEPRYGIRAKHPPPSCDLSRVPKAMVQAMFVKLARKAGS